MTVKLFAVIVVFLAIDTVVVSAAVEPRVNLSCAHKKVRFEWDFGECGSLVIDQSSLFLWDLGARVYIGGMVVAQSGSSVDLAIQSDEIYRAHLQFDGCQYDSELFVDLPAHQHLFEVFQDSEQHATVSFKNIFLSDHAQVANVSIGDQTVKSEGLFQTSFPFQVDVPSLYNITACLDFPFNFSSICFVETYFSRSIIVDEKYLVSEICHSHSGSEISFFGGKNDSCIVWRSPEFSFLESYQILKVNFTQGQGHDPLQFSTLFMLNMCVFLFPVSDFTSVEFQLESIFGLPPINAQRSLSHTPTFYDGMRSSEGCKVFSEGDVDFSNYSRFLLSWIPSEYSLNSTVVISVDIDSGYRIVDELEVMDISSFFMFGFHPSLYNAKSFQVSITKPHNRSFNVNCSFHFPNFSIQSSSPGEHLLLYIFIGVSSVVVLSCLAYFTLKAYKSKQHQYTSLE
eukprot:TRINITY_DN4323_c0_g1_i1.p1 TRINITY_DN4323_c0_g1~~TRINITY_DN4323_c0_g1_i1.p1  ORF type:complete len:462 (-),score=102.51 TRINITY_DN4323_c0_g1_i1:108-1472(-)